MAVTAKTKIFLDIYHPTADKKCAVKLEIYFDGKRKHYPTKYKLSQEDYDKIFTKKPRKEQKEILEDLVFFEEKANGIIKGLKDKFSFVQFQKMFDSQKGNSTCIFELMVGKSKILRHDGKISTAVILECAGNSLKTFCQKKNLYLEAIDVPFLNAYERWMRDEGNSVTTVGMYLRSLRTIFNQEIEEGTIPKEIYPFRGKKGYTIPTGRNIKKALIKSDVAKIFFYTPQTENLTKARDFWLLSYYGNGMNIKDIARLKFNNVDFDMIRFERAKTNEANKDRPIVISFQMTEEVKKIISRWGNKSTFPGGYIFPILENKLTADQQYKKIQLFVKFVNNNMKKIAKELDIKTNLTTYVARHTFSTVMIKSGKNIEFVKQALGHANIKTTQNYIGDFDDESKREMASELINFGTD